MTAITVKPRRQRGEILFVAAASIVILAIASLLILRRGAEEPEQKLKWYQISAFASLPSAAQGIFMELYTGAFDIEMFHRSNQETWPDVATLETNLIPPFEKSPVWESRGRLQWTLLPLDNENVHRAAYIGKTDNPAICGSFLVVLEHFHTMDGAYFSGVNKKTPFNIWYFPEGFKAPADFTDGALVAAGWKEAIPYRGTDELKKLKRGN